MFRIGIDIGGTKVNIGLFDILNKRLLATDKTYIKDISTEPLFLRPRVFWVAHGCIPGGSL